MMPHAHPNEIHCELTKDADRTRTPMADTGCDARAPEIPVEELATFAAAGADAGVD
jgi:hypothetical protein